MRQRGRKAAAALRLVHSDDGERLAGPSTLTSSQKMIWDSTVEAMPSDWFTPEHGPLLEQYCVIVDRTRAINKKMNDEKVGSALYFRLLYIEQKYIRHIAMLATKMRIAQQSTYDKSRRKGSRNARPAWDAADEIPQDDEE